MIEKGASFEFVYNEVFDNIKTPFGFRFYLTKIKKIGNNIKYGFYAADNIPVKNFLSLISRGVQSTIKVTIPEGFNVFEIASVLERMNIVSKQKFINDAFNPEIVKKITGETKESMEGLLAPGTYMFPKHYDNISVIKMLYNEFLKKLPFQFEEKVNALGLSKYEALILASIVQKETYKPEEAPIVASVFYNRLKYKMRLQADPTIIYGKYLEFDGNIRKQDIQDSSNIFNTYRHNGLPPTPICNPSITTLKAVMNPEQTSYIYFVADKKGNHIFSSDYRQHVNNVRKYQKQ